MQITEYTVVELEGHGENSYYSIKLGEGMYYKTYNDDGIKTTHEIGLASRIANEQFALELIGFLQNFFNLDGSIRQDNVGKVLPPLVGYAEAAEILGWDKRKIGTYMQRGVFPEPLQRLASGPIWTYKQIEDYKTQKEMIKVKYQGLVKDRMNLLETRETKLYDSYKEAHEAAEKLCKRTYGDRGSIDVKEVE